MLQTLKSLNFNAPREEKNQNTGDYISFDHWYLIEITLMNSDTGIYCLLQYGTFFSAVKCNLNGIAANFYKKTVKSFQSTHSVGDVCALLTF